MSDISPFFKVGFLQHMVARETRHIMQYKTMCQTTEYQFYR